MAEPDLIAAAHAHEQATQAGIEPDLAATMAQIEAILTGEGGDP